MIGSGERVGRCHKCVNAVCCGTFRHSQALFNMGGAVIDTRQYMAVEIDQFSIFLAGLDVVGLKKKRTTPRREGHFRGRRSEVRDLRSVIRVFV